MTDMNINKNIFEAVSTNLFSSLRDVKSNFMKDPERSLNPSRSVDEMMENSKSKNSSRRTEIYIRRKKLIRDLKREEKALNDNLKVLTENENLLKNKNFLSLTRFDSNKKVENTLLKEKMLKISKVKDSINNRLSEINSQINTLIYQESKLEGITKEFSQEKLRAFLENYENEKEDFNSKIAALQKDSEIRRQRMLNEIENKMQQKQKEISSLEKSKQDEKMKYLNQLKNEEKDIISKRTKVNNQKLLRLKAYINEKAPQKLYSFITKKNEYIQRENKLVYDETQRRKKFMKHIDLKEFKDFAKKFEEAKAKSEEAQQNQRTELKQKWVERSKLVPKYVPPILMKCEEDIKNVQKSIEMKREERIKVPFLMKEYSKRVPKPKKLVNPPQDHEDPKKLCRSRSTKEGLHGKMNSLRPIKKYPKIEKRKRIEDLIIPIPKIKKRARSPEPRKRKVEPLLKPIDYLTEERLRRQKRRSASGSKELFQQSENTKEIDRILKSSLSTGSLNESIKIARNKITAIENQVRQKEQLLRVNGGIEYNPELGNEVCNLILDSIKGKLSILEKINSESS